MSLTRLSADHRDDVRRLFTSNDLLHVDHVMAAVRPESGDEGPMAPGISRSAEESRAGLRLRVRPYPVLALQRSELPSKGTTKRESNRDPKL